MKNLILLISLICTIASAQNSVNKVFEQPQKYKIPVEGVELAGNAETIPGVIWRVYSDRDDNVTYKDPTGGEEFKKINFLESYYVVEENRAYVRIITESNVQETGLLFEDYGWARKSDLLLWDHCLVSAKTAENKQVMVVNTSEHYRLTPLEEMSNHKIAPVFINPTLTGKTTKSVDLYNLFYIYKETDNAVLIGNDLRYSSTGDDIESIILGWVPKTRLTNWNHKIYLEPNVEKKAMKELKGITKFLFHDKVSAGLYKQLKIIQPEYLAWSDEGESKRMPGNTFRFPILDEKNGIYKVGIIGEVKYWKNEKDKIEELKKDKSDIVSPFKLEILDYLWQLDSLGTKLKWAYDNSYQMYEESYTIKDFYDKSSSLFQFATVKDGYELTEINEYLTYLNNVISNSKKKRNKVLLAYASLLKDHIEKDDLAIMEMTFEEINNILFGLPASTLPKGLKLKELEDENRIDKDVYKEFANNLSSLQKQYSKMLNDDDFEFAFSSNNKKYYWINEEYIP